MMIVLQPADAHQATQPRDAPDSPKDSHSGAIAPAPTKAARRDE